jgi:hypothetical protein
MMPTALMEATSCSSIAGGTGLAAWAAGMGAGHPAVPVKPVTDSGLLDRQGLLNEFRRETAPLATAGSPEALALSKEIARETARRYGLSSGSAEGYATGSAFRA